MFLFKGSDEHIILNLPKKHNILNFKPPGIDTGAILHEKLVKIYVYVFGKHMLTKHLYMFGKGKNKNIK